MTNMFGLKHAANLSNVPWHFYNEIVKYPAGCVSMHPRGNKEKQAEFAPAGVLALGTKPAHANEHQRWAYALLPK